MDPAANWLVYAVSLLAAGVVASFAAGLFGVGGGILLVPIFLYLFPYFGVDSAVVMHLAVGTALAVAVPAAVTATLAQRRQGNLDIPFLRSWVPALGAGVIVGLVAMRFIPGHILIGVFAVVLIVAAVQMLATGDDFSLTNRLPSGWARSLMAIVIGALSAMLGLSGGTFTTPALSACGYPIHRAIAVSSAGGLVISAVGALGSMINGLGVPGRTAFSAGYVDVAAWLLMSPAVLLAAPWGVRLANHLSQHRLRRVFGVFLILVALDMFRNLLSH